MATIQGVLLLQPTASPSANGATAKVYPASASFAHSPPIKGDAFPASGLIAQTVTGPNHGSDGAYRFTGLAAASEFYVGIQLGGNVVVWDYHSTR